MSEARAKMIQKEAARIRAAIRDGLLYDQPIDMDNPDEIIIAAWMAGEVNERIAQMGEEKAIQMKSGRGPIVMHVFDDEKGRWVEVIP